MFEYDTKLENRTMIQKEEADIIKDLKDLLELAISRWHKFSGPLSEFLRKFIMDEQSHKLGRRIYLGSRGSWCEAGANFRGVERASMD